jgi:hypothetical protein
VSNLNKEEHKRDLAIYLDDGRWEQVYESLSKMGHCKLEDHIVQVIRYPNSKKIGKIIRARLETQYPSITIEKLKEKVNKVLGRNDLCEVLDEFMACDCAYGEVKKSSMIEQDQLNMLNELTKCNDCANREVRKLSTSQHDKLDFYLGKKCHDEPKSPEFLVDHIFDDVDTLRHIKQSIANEKMILRKPTDELLAILIQQNSYLRLITIYEVLAGNNIDDAAVKMLEIIGDQVRNALYKGSSAVENSDFI